MSGRRLGLLADTELDLRRQTDETSRLDCDRPRLRHIDEKWSLFPHLKGTACLPDGWRHRSASTARCCRCGWWSPRPGRRGPACDLSGSPTGPSARAHVRRPAQQGQGHRTPARLGLARGRPRHVRWSQHPMTLLLPTNGWKLLPELLRRHLGPRWGSAVRSDCSRGRDVLVEPRRDPRGAEKPPAAGRAASPAGECPWDSIPRRLAVRELRLPPSQQFR